MLHALVEHAVNKPVTVIILTLLVIVFGIGSAFFLPVRFYPAVSVPRITLSTTWAGLPAKDVQELITIPVEDTMSSLPGLRNSRSSSLDGISIIELTFSWGTDAARAGIRAREMADLAALELPEGASKPMVLPVNPADKPVMIVGVFPRAALALPDLKRLCEREIKSMLQQAEGTGSVQLLGGLDEEILVEPDPEKLGNYGIPLQALAQAIMATNTDVPAGSLEEGAMEYIVKTSSPVKQAHDISGIPVFNGDRENGFPRIRDLARITPSTADRTSFVLHENREGIALLIRAREGYSPVSLSNNVCAKISEIQHAYGSSLCIMALSDTSTMITSSIRDLLLSSLAGMIIAFFVIVLFLGNFRSSCLVTLSIPLSILSALAVFPLAGVGINIMSMGGLAIGTGMLVDNPVVVLENLQRKADPANRKGVINATVEIGASTIGSTFTSLIVFLPLFFLPGIMGVVFRDLAWAVSLSLLSSFIVSISALPVLYTRFGLGSKGTCPGRTAYRRLLRRAYRRPAVCAAAGLFLLCTGLLVFFFLEKDWLNTPETNRYLVRIQLPPGSSIEYQKHLAEKTQRILAARKEIAQSFFYGGGDYRDPYYVAGKDPEHETVFCHVVTAHGSGITAENAGAWFSALFADENIQGIATPESLSFNEVLGVAGTGKTIFPVTGTTHREALSRATRFGAALSCPDMIISPAATRTHVNAKPRNDVLDHLGLDNASIASILGNCLFGVYAGSLDTPRGRIPVRIRLAEEFRKSPQALASLSFPISQTASTTLAETIQLEESRTPPVYYRYNRQHVVYLSVPSGNRPACASLRGQLADPESADWRQQIRTILLLFCLAIFLMYALLGIQFDSFVLPLLLLAVLPFGFSGVFIALFLAGKTITLNGVLGSLVVIGVVVNNGIIFYDTFSHRIPDASRALAGTYRGANDRIRAILVSFFTTFLALVPVALDITGQNPQSSMATGVIGGISAATLVSIIGFPIVFRHYFAAQKGRANHA